MCAITYLRGTVELYSSPKLAGFLLLGFVASLETRMPDLLAVTLICASTIPHASCDRASATDVMVRRASTLFECLMNGQTMVAWTALDGTLGQGSYLKIVCEPPWRAAMATAPAPRATKD
jgi:hypothetical protein